MTLSAFLTEAGLGVYVSTLAAQGYDDLQTVRGLDASDLATMCTSVNMLPGHIATLKSRQPQQLQQTMREERQSRIRARIAKTSVPRHALRRNERTVGDVSSLML